MPKVDAVFEGGGVKGIGLVGALTVAEEKGYTWENVAGTSAGAIVAALVAAGYTSGELKEIMEKLDYNDFKDPGLVDRIPLIGPILSLGFEKGIYEGDFFERWIRTLLQKKGVRRFKDLIMESYKEDPRYRYKLRVIAADISKERLLVLPQDIADYGEEPDNLDVARAVRMSMSIPFFFEPVKLKDKETGEVSYIVDGGILSNFPVWLFDTEGEEPKWPTFGFKLVEEGEEDPDKVRHTIKGPITLLAALFSTMMDAHDARYIADQDFVRTIAIPTLGVKTTDFHITQDKCSELYESGRRAAEEFFSTWDFDTYIKEFRKGKETIKRHIRVHRPSKEILPQQPSNWVYGQIKEAQKRWPGQAMSGGMMDE